MTTILVIEDEPELREEIVDLLQFEGLAALDAADGITGLELAVSQAPDLILCDIMMPGMDGYAVLQEIRARPQTASVPFVFMTAKAARGDMRHGMELGANDYLTKPFNRRELLATIDAQITRQRIIEDRYDNQLEELRLSVAATLPHELRTPLTTIIGYADLMSDEIRERCSDLSPMLDRVRDAGWRLFRLIENYLLYVQLEVVPLSPESIINLNPRQMSSACADTQTAIAQLSEQYQRDNDLEVQLQDAALVIEPTYFNKIVFELIDNALKFSESGQPVQIVGWSEGDHYHLTVTDSGIGMTEEQLTSIGAFVQFERRIREQQGSGLGLLLARRLCLLHQGVFHVNSQPGRGTQVHLTFPLFQD